MWAKEQVHAHRISTRDNTSNWDLECYLQFTACFSTLATSLGTPNIAQFKLELLFRHFDGVVDWVMKLSQ
jgi:hypothetical protein